MADLPPVRILIVTEDSGKQAQPTLHLITRKALKLIDPQINLAPDRVSIDPLDPEAEAWLSATANRWKQRPPTRHLSHLLGTIATRLSEEGGFVIFHFDSDTTWSRRRDSDNRRKFVKIIRSGVELALRGGVRSPIERRPAPGIDMAEIKRRLSRLIVFCPCYSIESWLFQNTALLATKCASTHRGSPEVKRAHARMIDAWAADRTLLDEVTRPKDDALPCVADRWNAELAKGFPSAEIYAADRSFAEAVGGLNACADLLLYARSTYDPAPHPNGAG